LEQARNGPKSRNGETGDTRIESPVRRFAANVRPDIALPFPPRRLAF
jgi:hypothetical protein